jgi:4-hydroxybenzoate polyprenyltransferase
LIALILASIFGWVTVVMMLFMLVVGWSYNLGLKATGFSVVPYAVGFGILPVFVTLSVEQSQFPSWWVILASSLLGVSAHFANTLPDLDKDKQTGVRALPNILGQRGSALVIAGAAISASILIITQSPSLNLATAASGLTLSVGLAVTASVLALRPAPPRVIFHLLIAASFVNVVLLILG